MLTQQTNNPHENQLESEQQILQMDLLTGFHIVDEKTLENYFSYMEIGI